MTVTSTVEVTVIFGFAFFLNMICVLFKSNFALLRTKTGIMRGMVSRYLAREDGRKGKKSTIDTESVLVKLGKLAWTGLTQNKFIFSRDEVVREAGLEALELGLLIGTEDPHPSEEEADMLCFPHLLFQEFVAAHYIAQLNKKMLESLFSKWGYILRHQDVVKFACVLSNQTEMLLEVIYAALTDYLKPQKIKPMIPQLYRSDHGSAWYQQFLQSLEKELSEKMQFDAFHNKYFNYTTTDDPKLFIPSNFNLFDDQTPAMERLKVCQEYSDTHRQAHSSIIITNKSSFVRVLHVLKYLHTIVGVVVDCMCFFGDETIEESLKNKLDPEEETKLLKQGLKFGDSTKVISLCSLHLSQSALKYIINQLASCKNLTALSLFNIQDTIPLGFGASIRAMTSLKFFRIDSCKMTEATVQKLMLGLSQCFTLQYMLVMNEKITGNIGHFCGGPGHPGFPSLIALAFVNTKINLDDINNLVDAMRRNKFPSLKVFNFLDNILTDIINTLFVEGGNLLQIDLVLQNCGLSKHDVENVFKASAPFVKYRLDLSRNTLTGVIGASCSNIGLPFTKILNLQNCELDKVDFEEITSAILNGKLPNLQSLDLYENDLRCIQVEVEELVKACVTCYSMRFDLYLSVGNMEEPGEFMVKINSMCQDTSVCVKLNIGMQSESIDLFNLQNAFPPGLLDDEPNLASLARFIFNTKK